MIQPNELRIGNYVIEGRTVIKIDFRNNDFWHTENFQPIPLTPEVLEKCGFEDDDNDFLIDISERTSLHINLLKKRTLLESYDGIIALSNIVYLHQLQNLYFALTGEELEYKP